METWKYLVCSRRLTKFFAYSICSWEKYGNVFHYDWGLIYIPGNCVNVSFIHFEVMFLGIYQLKIVLSYCWVNPNQYKMLFLVFSKTFCLTVYFILYWYSDPSLLLVSVCMVSFLILLLSNFLCSLKTMQSWI